MLTRFSMSKVLIGLGLSILVSHCAGAADLQKIAGQKEIWSGVYEGQLDWTHEPHLIKETGHIPGRVGTSFGTYFTLRTEPADAAGIVRLRYKTVFPEPGIRDARTGRMVREVVGVTECILGKACLAGYTFDSPDEIIPGEWRFVVSFRDVELLSKSFSVESAH